MKFSRFVRLPLVVARDCHGYNIFKLNGNFCEVIQFLVDINRVLSALVIFEVGSVRFG